MTLLVRLASSLALALIAGCGIAAGKDEDADRPPSTAAVSTTVTLPRPTPYEVLPGEPARDAKVATVRVLEALGNYEEGGGTPQEARERLAGLAAAPDVAGQVAPLLVPDTVSTLEIVYPQLGGLTEDAASVMTVVRHRTLDDAEITVVSRTIDVRLQLSADGWAVTSIASTGGEPIADPMTSPAGGAVLANTAIELPDSARWDIEAARVEDRILEVLNRVADRRRVSVTVLASGHPHEVFGGSSVSNHTKGRGVDIWAVDGTPVFEQRDVGGPLYQLVEDLLAEGVTELGSPWDLDGVGSGASFTNTVHQDHVHIAFDGA